jgi:RNA polymerase sigma-70 factor (ECF subfamily)
MSKQAVAVGSSTTRASGDIAVFEDLVRQHYQQAYTIAYRLTGSHADADDLTQEALVRAYQSFDRYQRHLPFANWLYRIMVNLHIDEIRRRPRHRLESVDATEGGLDIPDRSSDPAEVILARELDERLQVALGRLPNEFRTAVLLCDVQGFSYEEIAEIMRCSIGTVRSRVHRGRKQLRAALLSMGHDVRYG